MSTKDTAESREKTCFVICPIGKKDSDIRKHSNQVLEHIIQPVVEQFGYNSIRADQIDQPGLITQQIIGRIMNSPLVIADLSYLNPNVFYELAIRHIARLPVILLIRDGETIPFDVYDLRTIRFNLGNPDSIKEAKQLFTAQLKTIEEAIEKGDSHFDNPISIAIGRTLTLLEQKSTDGIKFETNIGIKNISYGKFSYDNLDKYIDTVKEIKIIFSTGRTFIGVHSKGLQAAMKRGCRIQILAATPESDYIKDLHEIQRDNVRGEIGAHDMNSELRYLSEFIKSHKPKDADVAVEHYRTHFRANMFLFIGADKMEHGRVKPGEKVGFYMPTLPPTSARDGVCFELSEGELLDACEDHFDSVMRLVTKNKHARKSDTESANTDVNISKTELEKMKKDIDKLKKENGSFRWTVIQ